LKCYVADAERKSGLTVIRISTRTIVRSALKRPYTRRLSGHVWTIIMSSYKKGDSRVHSKRRLSYDTAVHEACGC